tara:strand:+ start:1196 stop:3016 length:1821 start_codon:yes stop_codon:yes gene_type:complete
MGFTPFKAFVKGGAEFAQKVALARLEGQYELKKLNAKTQAENAGKLVNFQAGDVSLTFTNSDLDDKDARNQANITDMNKILGSNNYQRYIQNAKRLPGGVQKIADLNNFLIGRTSLWASGTAQEEKVGDAVKVVKYRDITVPYSEYLGKGYGEEFIRDVVAPAYSVNYERFQKKYPKKLGFMSDKKLTSDKFISYEHIPYLTEDVYKSGDGRFIIQEANDAAKRLNTPYQKLLGAWQTGTTDAERLDVKKQRVIWDIYAELKKTLPPKLDPENLGTYTRTISAARKQAFNNGISPDVFATMLQAFVPSFNATDVKPFIYSTTSLRDEAIAKQHSNHLYTVYKIDAKEAAAKGQAARGASGLATRMYQIFENNALKTGGGTLQPTVAGATKMVAGIMGEGGILQGFRNVFSDWRANEKGFNTVGRSRLAARMDRANSLLQKADSNSRERARIEFMKFNLAYQMASAFQGGTGGRTISDQDIENMMAAMNFGAGSSESQIIQSLKTIASIMEDIAVIQDGYKKGGKSAAVSYILEKTNEQFGVDFSKGGNFADYAVAKLEGKVATADQFAVGRRTVVLDNPAYDKTKPDEMRRKGIQRKLYKSVPVTQ